MNLVLVPDTAAVVTVSRGDERFSHLTRVLRVHRGDRVRAGVPGGPRGVATVRRIDRESIELEIEWTEPPDESLDLTVLLGHPRPPVLERLWRDLAAARVGRIVVFPGQLGERSYLNSSAWERCETALHRGLSQGVHTALPRVDRARSLGAALRSFPLGAHRFVGSTGEVERSLTDAVRLIEGAADGGVVICIGPERGLTADEEAALAGVGFIPIRLTATTLRTESATIALAVACASILDRRQA